MSLTEEDDRNPFAAPESDLAPEQFGIEPDPFDYGGFVARVIAAILDGIILEGVVIVVVFTAELILFGRFPDSSGPPWFVFVAGFVWAWLYFALFESSRYQATPGKMAAGLQVRDLAGEPISFLRATGRTLSKAISYMSCWIGFLMQPFTRRRQMLHDILAGCIVVKRPRS